MSGGRRQPAHLGPAGSRIWAAVAGDFDLRADEERVLEDACREADLVDRLEEALRDAPLLVKGSQGQPAASPLVSELRQHRTVLARLLAQLRIADEDPVTAAESRTSQATRAARARWDRRSIA